MGHRTSIKNPRLTKRLPLEEAETVFLNHCRIKNLSPRTIQYYQEDLEYFFAHLEGIRYADEITREVFEDYTSNDVSALWYYDGHTIILKAEGTIGTYSQPITDYALVSYFRYLIPTLTLSITDHLE